MQASVAWKQLSEEQKQAYIARFAANNEDPELDNLPEPEAPANSEQAPTADKACLAYSPTCDNTVVISPSTKPSSHHLSTGCPNIPMPAESIQNNDVSSAASLLYLEILKGFLIVMSGSKLTYSFLWSSPTAQPTLVQMLINLCRMQPQEKPKS